MQLLKINDQELILHF